MFTGIVTAIGTVTKSEERGDLRVRVACPYDPATIAIGASIACSGACMTVVEKGGAAGDSWFAVDVSGESVSRTAPGMWNEGARLNLETALKLGDELGGHIVTGHVDAVGEVVDSEDIGGSTKLTIRAPKDIAAFIAPKGSITVAGVSLTVNDVTDRDDGTCDFTLNIIPHTGDVTTLGDLAEGDSVNLEIDVLARYLKRMQALAG
ncbi:riboflavin synthase [Pseudoblastomonas halimionae]|uniref:Riboflavin synthase n=1 Tax=Alteriqipengyuania halimionae TaxID=1926630 RepID=A0A6I4U2X8_9SPHN|nr:riboflavin synthase [Alteriqipengyuania halimionae]MXP10380.1 riboflavin synthase [Alteriqipengyuania halimionae]